MFKKHSFFRVKPIQQSTAHMGVSSSWLTRPLRLRGYELHQVCGRAVITAKKQDKPRETSCNFRADKIGLWELVISGIFQWCGETLPIYIQCSLNAVRYWTDVCDVGTALEQHCMVVVDSVAVPYDRVAMLHITIKCKIYAGHSLQMKWIGL